MNSDYKHNHRPKKRDIDGCRTLASFPGLLTPAFVACSTNTGEGLVKLVTCSDVGERYMDEWKSGTFTENRK